LTAVTWTALSFLSVSFWVVLHNRRVRRRAPVSR
jgi:hypothetical protein